MSATRPVREHGGAGMPHLLDFVIGLSCLATAALFPNMLGQVDAKASFRSAVAFGPVLFLLTGMLFRHVRRSRTKKGSS